MEVSQKIQNRTPLRSSNYISGYLFEENKNANLKRHLHLYVHSSITYYSQYNEAS